MLYLALPTAQAHQLTEALWLLTRPAHVRNPNDVTNSYCGVLDHPSNGTSCLVLPEQDDVPIHLEVAPQRIGEVLAPFIQSGNLTVDQLNEIGQKVMAKVGQRANLFEFMPAEWASQVMSEEQARRAGYFPENDLVV